MKKWRINAFFFTYARAVSNEWWYVPPARDTIRVWNNVLIFLMKIMRASDVASGGGAIVIRTAVYEIILIVYICVYNNIVRV